MPTLTVNETQAELPHLIDRALAGDEVVLTRQGRPVAKIVTTPVTLEPRPLGLFQGQIVMAPDFDELPPDLAAAFEGRQP